MGYWKFSRILIWGGTLMILLGTYLWYANPSSISTDVILIIAGVTIWLYGDKLAGAI